MADFASHLTAACDELIAAGRAYGNAHTPHLSNRDSSSLSPAEVTLAKMAFKRYAYFAALPAMRWWSTGRIPDLSLENLVVSWCPAAELLPCFQPSSQRAAVLAEIAQSGRGATNSVRPYETVASDEDALMDFVRETLIDAHLAPLARELAARYRIGPAPFYASISGGVYALYFDSLDHPEQAEEFYQRAQRILAGFGAAYRKLVRFIPVFDKQGYAHYLPMRNGCCMAYQWRNGGGCDSYCVTCRLIPVDQLKSKLEIRGLTLEPRTPIGSVTSDFDPQASLAGATP